MIDLLKVENLVVGYYEDINILQGVSLEAEKEDITAVLGPNGVGKSTLLKTICGFLETTSGTISFKGNPINGIEPHRAIDKGLVYLPQELTLFHRMTVQENLQLGGWTIRGDKKLVEERVEENYERFPILKEKSDQHVGNLSGGSAANGGPWKGVDEQSGDASGGRADGRTGTESRRRNVRSVNKFERGGKDDSFSRSEHPQGYRGFGLHLRSGAG